MAQETRAGLYYGPGGYRVSLDQSRWRALEDLQRLQNGSWLDEKTRAVNVEVSKRQPSLREEFVVLLKLLINLQNHVKHRGRLLAVI